MSRGTQQFTFAPTNSTVDSDTVVSENSPWPTDSDVRIAVESEDKQSTIFKPSVIQQTPVPAPTTTSSQPVEDRTRTGIFSRHGIILIISVVCLSVAATLTINAVLNSDAGKTSKSVSSDYEFETATPVETTPEATKEEDVTSEAVIDESAEIEKARITLAAGDYTTTLVTLESLSSDEAKELKKETLSAQKRNTLLLAKVGKQKAQGDWKGVLITLTAIEKLHPLSTELEAIRSEAKSAQASASGGGNTAIDPNTATTAPTVPSTPKVSNGSSISPAQPPMPPNIEPTTTPPSNTSGVNPAPSGLPPAQ